MGRQTTDDEQTKNLQLNDPLALYLIYYIMNVVSIMVCQIK